MTGCTLRYFGPVLAPNYSELLLHAGWVFQNVLRFLRLPILCHHWQGGGSRCACGGKKRCLHVYHAWGAKKFSRFHSANGTAWHASQRIFKEFHSLSKHVESLNGLFTLSPPIEVIALWVFWCLIVLVSLAASSVCWSLATCLAQEAPPADEASDSATRSDRCKLWTWNQTEQHRYICSSSIINVLCMRDFSRHPDLFGGTVPPHTSPISNLRAALEWQATEDKESKPEEVGWWQCRVRRREHAVGWCRLAQIWSTVLSDLVSWCFLFLGYFILSRHMSALRPSEFFAHK